jgi:hypothetical protein
MMSLKVLWAMRPAHSFWQIWITITAAAAICGMVVVRPSTRKAAKQPITPILTWRHLASARAVAALTLLAVFLVSYIAMGLVWEDFAYYDNSAFTLHTLQGQDFAPGISRSEGRFWPLGYQEFNLIRHFTDTNLGYHVLPIVQLLIFSSVLLVLDVELSFSARATLTILALLTPSILISFNGLMFPERNVLFFLVCLALSVNRFERTQSIAWAGAAVVCAQIMIYYKETAFLLLLGFAAGRLILRCRGAPDALWDYRRLWDRESRLDLCLISLAALFLLYYAAGMGLYHYFEGMNISATEMYQAKNRVRLAVAAREYLKLDLLSWLFLVVVVGRTYLILRHRVAPSPFWDGLAFGGVACFLAYLYLGLVLVYYLAPVDLIAVLYVGRFAVLSWPKMHSRSKVIASTLASIALLQNFLYSALAVFDRKNLIHGSAEIASVVEMRYRTGGGATPRLYFPFARPYEIMQFAGYLHYRGIPVEGAGGEAAALNSVVLATPAVFKDGLCVSWEMVMCHAASGPAPGDLVIVLPDDQASVVEASVYREPGELLFSYRPFPPVLRDLYSLGIPDVIWRFKTPDRWMDGSVTLWKEISH